MNVSTHSANNRSRVAYRKSSQISLLHQFQNVTRDDRDFSFQYKTCFKGLMELFLRNVAIFRKIADLV